MSAVNSSFNSPPSVAIALCTYQGERFVNTQLESLLAQSYPAAIHVLDDASTDATVACVSARLRDGVDTLTVQPVNVGYVRNFENAISVVLDSAAQYIALSDQDDVWHERRIEQGLQRIRELEQVYGASEPLLVHSDLQLIDTNGKSVHDSFLGFRRYRIDSQRNLLVVLGENGVMGNTILMNRALAERCLPFPNGLHVHDYWIALIAELLGHRAVLSAPTVRYRLHTANASNTASSMRVSWLQSMQNLTWQTLIERNFKLPYKEDSRLLAIESILDDSMRFPIDSQQRKTLQGFITYLKFEQSRLKSLQYLLCSGAVRPGFLHRLRLCAVTLLTTRYP